MTESKDLKDEIRKLSETVNELSHTAEKEAAKAARVAALEEISRLKETIDYRFEKRTRTFISIAAFLVVVLTALGVFGVLGKWLGGAVEESAQKAEALVQQIDSIHSMVGKEPLIILETDFGNRSSSVGVMIGHIYKVNPRARIQIITNEIARFDVWEAAWTLWRASRFFPEGAIFVVPINPGGTNADPIVLTTENGHVYIGYDNGCFDFVATHHKMRSVVKIAHPLLASPTGQDDFGTHDIFAPTAGRISLGFSPDSMGKKRGYENRFFIKHDLNKTGVVGIVMDEDRFGNIMTNITKEDLDSFGYRFGDTLIVSFLGQSIPFPYWGTYGLVPEHHLVAIQHDGLLQLAINLESLSTRYNLPRETEIEIRAQN